MISLSVKKKKIFNIYIYTDTGTECGRVSTAGGRSAEWLAKYQRILVFKNFFFFKDFIYLFDRERSQVDGEAGREREGSRLPAEQRARCGTRSQDPEIMT